MTWRLRELDARSRFWRHRGRLALLRPPAQVASYWNDYWHRAGKVEQLVDHGERGDLGEYEALFSRWLRKDALVLEAGCGPAHIVLALHRRGYRALGIDLDTDVVRMVHERYPELDVRVGDVFKLDLPDASVGAYISLGVIEHFEDGPVPILREARRVLAPDGTALISVPVLNAARRQHLEHARLAADPPEGLSFYQYYYDQEELTGLLGEAGLEVVETAPLFVENHLTRDHGLLSRYWNWRWHPTRTRLVERYLLAQLKFAPELLRRRWAHMLMFVCRPR